MKPTIAFYVVSTHLGGAERSLLEVLEAARASGLGTDLLVLVPKREGPLLEELARRELPYEVVELPRSLLSASRQRWAASITSALLSGPAVAAYVGRVTKTLARRNTRVVHTTGIKMHVLGAVAGRAAGARVLWHLRDILSPGATHALLRGLEKAARPKVIANSRATALSYGPSAEVLYNGIDTELFKPQPRAALKRELNCGDGLPVVGICGVLARWKGQFEFVEAASSLLASGTRAHFVIIGDEIYDTRGERGLRAQLQDRIDATGFSAHIRITGFRGDMPRVYSALDVLVHASIRPEPFGRVLIEAMACGVPVLASRDGGVREIVTDEADGLLFEPGNTRELAQKIGRLLKEPELRERLGTAGRATVMRRFSFDRFKERLASTLRGLL